MATSINISNNILLLSLKVLVYKLLPIKTKLFDLLGYELS